MASSKLTLTYFDLRGLGEVARIVLAYAGKQYKDVRVSDDEWTTMKSSQALEQLPILDIDGDKICQSIPIWNFLAKEFGLYPQSNRDQLTVDVVAHVQREIVTIHNSWYYLPDGDDRTEKGVQAHKDNVKYLKFMEGLLAKSGTGYVLGNAVTLADIIVFDTVTGYCRESIDYSDDMYPLIAKNKENVLKVEKIAAYVASRPDSVL